MSEIKDNGSRQTEARISEARPPMKTHPSTPTEFPPLTMTYMRSPSLEPLISALFPRPDEYWNLYERGPDTNALVDSVMVNVIQKHQQSLRKGHKLYQLDSLLHGMLTEAPHPAGKRHVAVSLHIAHTKGDAAVLELAKVWMENLFLPS